MVDVAVTRPPRVAATPWLRLLPPLARFSFRGAAAAQGAAGPAFGVTFPTVACHAATNGSRAALWLGPDEQLLLAPVAEGPAARSVLDAALVDLPHSLVDVSHRQGALELRGPNAAWLLNGGCPLDLDVRTFTPGMCTRSVFAKTEIVLWRTAADVFHVEIGRSFTDYLVGMLREIARELPG
ncbi:MAG TPA: sarcosine oxidase subunit gamma family protein [Steroidobacteraceae bacterium]|nr:sarcosine oxidase subunit gamma family protein [Steroidobacteraceae bacterium]